MNMMGEKNHFQSKLFGDLIIYVHHLCSNAGLILGKFKFSPSGAGGHFVFVIAIFFSM